MKNNEIKIGTHNARVHGLPVIILSKPRRIAGGCVVLVAWAEDSKDPRMILADGSVHPAHRKGFQWEEPSENIER